MDHQGHSVDYKGMLLDISYGILSGVLYLTYVFSFFFLAPLQYAYARKGLKTGIRASLASLIVILVGMLVSLGGSLSALQPKYLVAGIVPPLLFMIAVWYINSGLGKSGQGQKVVLVSALLSIVAWPFLTRMLSDVSFVAGLEEMLQENLAGISGQAADAAVVHSTLESALKIVKSAYAPVMLCFTAANWWLGSGLAAIKAVKQGKADGTLFQKRNITDMHVPYSLLWPTLLAWTALLIVTALHKEGPIAWIAWNVALFLAALYAAQGIGILNFFSKRFKAGGILRLLLPLLIIVGIINQTAAVIILIALPLLGITEVWFPYRNFKGARL
ncbi:MAG: DUF2232 domain-containing protein [Spirochaetaceae bacterium]|nr:DUF2232 domain-containing protein [Spirochaetaceae bacterium]